MRHLAQIRSLYAEIDQSLETARSDAAINGDVAAIVRIDEKLLLNDQAYFVLCWGQLEAEIDDACRAVIRRRKSNPSWDMRRGFDFYDQDDRRLSGLPFDRRAAILLDRSAGRGSPFAKVSQYYETRNKIAHGRLSPTRIDIVNVISDFYLIQAAIKR